MLVQYLGWMFVPMTAGLLALWRRPAGVLTHGPPAAGALWLFGWRSVGGRLIAVPVTRRSFTGGRPPTPTAAARIGSRTTGTSSPSGRNTRPPTRPAAASGRPGIVSRIPDGQFRDGPGNEVASRAALPALLSTAALFGVCVFLYRLVLRIDRMKESADDSPNSMTGPWRIGTAVDRPYTRTGEVTGKSR
jgi:hypothetical protein